MVKGAKVCAILSCKAQNDKEHGKQGGFFSLPSLEKKRELRQLWVNQARLPEAYMRTTCHKRICFRHFQPSDFDTSGQRLTIIIGTFSTLPILKKFVEPFVLLIPLVFYLAFVSVRSAVRHLQPNLYTAS